MSTSHRFPYPDTTVKNALLCSIRNHLILFVRGAMKTSRPTKRFPPAILLNPNLPHLTVHSSLRRLCSIFHELTFFNQKCEPHIMRLTACLFTSYCSADNLFYKRATTISFNALSTSVGRMSNTNFSFRLSSMMTAAKPSPCRFLSFFITAVILSGSK